jgi:hypothetical protein
MDACSARLVLVKEIPGQEDKVYLAIFRQLEDLAKGIDGILTSDGILFGVAYVIVCSEHDTEAAVKATEGNATESRTRREEKVSKEL